MAEGQTTRGSGVSKRGFASMDPERQREIARKGGATLACNDKGLIVLLSEIRLEFAPV